jgi:hypothetical protein
MNKVVSTKIPKELKNKADKYGVKIGNLVRETLEAKVSAIESETLSTKIDDLSSKIGSKIKKGDVVKAIRLSRDEK